MPVSGRDTGMDAPARQVHAAPHATAPRSAAGLPRPVGALIPAITRPAFRRRAPASAQILADWPLIVGPALSAVTEPRRLVGGTLTLACPGPVALELSHLTAQLAERINTHVGARLVERLRFVQTTLTPPTAPCPAAPPDPALAAKAAAAVATLPEGQLRDALAALGTALLQEAASHRSAPAKRPLDSAG